jgi:hypothetical protein
MIVAGTASATDYYVNQLSGNDANAGTSWAAAKATLDAGLALMIAGDTIHVAAGRYIPSTTNGFDCNKIPATIPSTLKSSMIGGYSATNPTGYQRNPDLFPTILDCDINGDDTAFPIYSATAPNDVKYYPAKYNRTDNALSCIDGSGAWLFDGLYCINGQYGLGSGWGCGIYVNSIDTDPATIYSPGYSTCEVYNCTFANHYSGGYGAAIYSIRGRGIVDNCQFINVVSGSSAVILMEHNWVDPGVSSYTNLNFVGCASRMHESSGRQDGYCLQFYPGEGTQYVDNMTARNNRCGALYLRHNGSTFNIVFDVNNMVARASEGQMVEFYSQCSTSGGATQDTDLDNCLIADNRSYATGVIHLWKRYEQGDGAPGHGLAVTNCTIANNRGPAIYSRHEAYGYNFGRIEVKNSIFWGNEAEWASTEKFQIRYDSTVGGVMSVTYSCVDTAADVADPCHYTALGTGCIASNPQFTGPDYHLASGSPCIDAGDPADSVGLEPACNGGVINMGCYGGTGGATPSAAAGAAADLDCDGNVNMADFAIMASQWMGP